MQKESFESAAGFRRLAKVSARPHPPCCSTLCSMLHAARFSRVALRKTPSLRRRRRRRRRWLINLPQKLNKWASRHSRSRRTKRRLVKVVERRERGGGGKYELPKQLQSHCIHWRIAGGAGVHGEL